DHRSAVEGSLPHSHIGVLDPVERETLDVGVDSASAGEVEYLDQLDRRSPVGNRQLRLEWQHAEGELQLAAGQADHGQVSLETGDLAGQRQGVVGADVIEDQLGAAPAGQL